jgi:hypothetical protein
VINPIQAPGTLARRSEWTTESCAIADTENDPVARYWAHRRGAEHAIENADGPSFARHEVVCDEESHRIPHATIQWSRAYNRIVAAVLRGELDEAERLNDAALAFGTDHGQRDAFQMYGAQLMNIRDHQGRMGEMAPLVEQAVVDTPGMPVYRAVLAHCYVDAGRDQDAWRLLNDDLGRGFEMRMDQSWTTAQANWAVAAARLHATDAAAALREHLIPYHDQIVFTGATVNASLAHHLGLLDHTLGRLDDADHWFAESMHLHERLRSPLFVAHTQAAWSALLADRSRADDRARARDMAEQALAAATAGGYGNVERDARAVLEQLG